MLQPRSDIVSIFGKNDAERAMSESSLKTAAPDRHGKSQRH
ncbi:hypothetical protein [Prosthecochloris sp.]|nr:hypothetical protein [Prosthecochloris sp.]